MIELAFHIYTAISYEIQNRKVRLAEYNEIMLHHALAVVMIFLCYLCSLFTFGITILITSDFSDMFLNMAKFVRDVNFMRHTKLGDYLFVCVLATWGYLRGVVICGCLMLGCIKVLYSLMTHDMTNFNPIVASFIFDFKWYYVIKISLVTILVLLNLYWMYIIMQISYNRIIRKDKNFTNTTHGEKFNKKYIDAKEGTKNK